VQSKRELSESRAANVALRDELETSMEASSPAEQSFGGSQATAPVGWNSTDAETLHLKDELHKAQCEAQNLRAELTLAKAIILNLES